ncbi:ABC transporter permease subunit [Petrotoga sp. 9PWA.NaAc.5.4]|uniref:ABC transporter permease subunit n=1 Tax=Petrotoga sp. 9PWA.NaAc.5.4 TaxID=1434328 RepID=UPI000CACA997|nr:ABC transporter permease subunit [Petrotoga sp. 9PWA.NaAc.5.4]PNR94575.1 hypothetical protein X924_05895 [Petrotoga sp. 9PWA.NaAc.5.4]
MKKEFLDIRLKVIIIFALMIGIFFTFAPFQDFTVSMFSEELPSVEKYLGDNFVENLKDWNFYITSQWFGKNFGQFVPIISIILAFSLFSREYERATIEFLVARLPRRKIFINKLLVSIITLLIIMFTLSILPSIYSIITAKDFNHSLIFKFMIPVLTGGFFWYSVTLLFSVLFNAQIKSLFASAILLTITTTLGFIKPLGFMNTYKYILGSELFHDGVNWIYTIILLLIGVVCIFFAYYTFEKKEI